jgi:hypothetical protein
LLGAEPFIQIGQTVFKLNSVAINPKPGVWLSFAEKDAGVLHATLCSVAMYCGLYHGLNSNVDIHYHKGEALQLVHKKLQNPREMTSDGPIAIITTLASFEVSLKCIYSDYPPEYRDLRGRSSLNITDFSSEPLGRIRDVLFSSFRPTKIDCIEGWLPGA